MDKPSTTANLTEYDSKPIQNKLGGQNPDETSPQSTGVRDPPADHPNPSASMNAESVSASHLMESFMTKDDLTADIGEHTSSFNNFFVTIETNEDMNIINNEGNTSELHRKQSNLPLSSTSPKSVYSTPLYTSVDTRLPTHKRVQSNEGTWQSRGLNPLLLSSAIKQQRTFPSSATSPFQVESSPTIFTTPPQLLISPPLRTQDTLHIPEAQTSSPDISPQYPNVPLPFPYFQPSVLITPPKSSNSRMDNPGLDRVGPLMQKFQLAQPLSLLLSSHTVSRDDISDFTINASKIIDASDIGEEGELVEPVADDSEEDAGFHESENFSFPWDEENSQILRLSIRAPLSDENYTERFLAIRPDLEAHLAPFKIEHVLTLTIAVISGNEVHWETPVVLLILTKEDDMFDIAGISSIIERGGFNIVVARGRIEFGDERINPTWAKEFHSQLCSGVAIGTPESNSHGTAGIFIRNGEDTFGVTCGHVAKSSSKIIQPGLPFFTTEYNNLIQRCEDIERRLRSPLLEQDRRSLEKTHKEYTEKIELLKSYIFSKTGLNETLEAGRVVTSRWEKMEYHGRKCYIDCAIFELNRIRGPVLFRDYPVTTPVEQPILSSISWAPCDRLGDIVYDMAVRKLGVTTGQTFGMIAGMHTKIYTKDDIPLSEYFVLSDSSIMKQTFAKASDSGSAIISGEGEFVGMYFATIFSDTIELVILQNTEDWPDFRRMAGRRKQDGTVDFEDTFKLAYKGVELALIQDARLLKDLMGLHHYGYVIQDL